MCRLQDGRTDHEEEMIDEAGWLLILGASLAAVGLVLGHAIAWALF